MCQILVFNAINTIVTDMECNIRIDRLPLGRGMDHDPWTVNGFFCKSNSVFPESFKEAEIINIILTKYMKKRQAL
jgi:hypothetical protein